MEPVPATVTQASPLLVQLDGAATGTRAYHLGAYSPTLSDRVAVVRYRGGLLVLGKEIA